MPNLKACKHGSSFLMAPFQFMALLPTIFHSKDSIVTKIYVVVVLLLTSDNGESP
jgi:hypothetical protein